METVRIYDIMACDVYWVFDGAVLPKEQHKFLVSLHPTGDTPTPELIDRIVARGPDGYEVTFTNQRFSNANRDGYIYDPTLNYYWYMVNLPTGYLDEGEYTIEVTPKRGEVSARSRVQRSASSTATVSAYTRNRDRILSTFIPSAVNPLPPGAPLHRLELAWATLRELDGPNAYYVTRLAEGGSVREFDTQRLVWWDNIYIRRARGTEPEAGRNVGAVTVDAELKPGTGHGYFVEITDGNVQSDANICVFQPHQFFTT